MYPTTYSYYVIVVWIMLSKIRLNILNRWPGIRQWDSRGVSALDRDYLLRRSCGNGQIKLCISELTRFFPGHTAHIFLGFNTIDQPREGGNTSDPIPDATALYMNSVP
ncbi:hypothetical protein BDF21DRAFT_402860 [Thamnidium elegans]|nr:hypothetical protein BDF21DRAFT_402860 [Thamnidium elegans]